MEKFMKYKIILLVLAIFEFNALASSEAFIYDKKTSGTDGGSCVAGSWIQRDVNDKNDPSGFVTLGANQFTLPPGDYEVSIVVPAYQTDRHQAKLVSVSGAGMTDVLVGASAFSPSKGVGTNTSGISGNFTLTTTTTLQILHQCETTATSNGFGQSTSIGNPEVYTLGKITRY
jgi:hypothetical protein